jgi:hypothetical protein
MLSSIWGKTNESKEIEYLLENLKGERSPEESLAAHPKAFSGCSCSGNFAIYGNKKVGV